MKTVNYIPRSEADRSDKVIDLEAWKAEHLTQPDAPEPQPARPRRRRKQTALDWAELAATLAVTAALLALVARVLLF